VEYVTLTKEDQSELLKNRLRGLESDHFTLSMLLEVDEPGTSQERVDKLEISINALKTKLKELQA
jgi:hypothetical protein